jgi:hypothetical protein
MQAVTEKGGQVADLNSTSIYNLDLFPVKVQLIFKCEVDYIMFSIFGLFIVIIDMKLDLIVIYCRLF